MRAPTPESGPERFSLTWPKAKGCQSSKRLKLLSVSNTIAGLRLVSTLSVRERLDGSSTPTTMNSTATIAREIRSSRKRVIQGSPGPGPAEAGAQTGNPSKIAAAAATFAARFFRYPASRVRRGHRASGGSDQLELERLEHRTRADAHAKLAEDVGDVVLDRAFGHAQRVGDLLVGEARGHQAQDLGLAIGQRIRPVEADEIVAHVLQARQQALGDRRLHQRAAAGHRTDGAHQLLQRHVLEQVALGPGLEPGQHQLVVVEGGEDDRGRQRPGLRQRLQRLEARHRRHAHVHQHDVGSDLRDHLHRLSAVNGLGHHFDPAIKREQGADALAYQGLVIDQAHADGAPGIAGTGGHGASMVIGGAAGGPATGIAMSGTSSVGSRRRRVKPCPGAVSASTSPPYADSRSRMPRRPLPAVNPSAPRPSSRATRCTAPRSSRYCSCSTLAWAWRTALVMISWVQRSSTWARSGSSIGNGRGSRISTFSPGTLPTSGSSVAAMSVVALPRIWLTASRTSDSSSRARVCA